MGGVIRDASDLLGFSTPASEEAAQSAKDATASQIAQWNRQFGPVSDSLRDEMMSVLGYTWVPPTTSGETLVPGSAFAKPLSTRTTTKGKWVKSPTNTWLDKFKSNMRTEIESGIRPGEESAKAALLDKVRSSPRSMSSQSYAKGLKDIVKEGASARGSAYRSGMTQAELTPYNMSLAFMGRTPFAPNVNPVYPPDYKVDTEGLKMMGGGLGDMFKAGSSLYADLYGPREVSGASGFELGTETGLGAVEEGAIL